MALVVRKEINYDQNAFKGFIMKPNLEKEIIWFSIAMTAFIKRIYIIETIAYKNLLYLNFFQQILLLHDIIIEF